MLRPTNLAEAIEEQRLAAARKAARLIKRKTRLHPYAKNPYKKSAAARAGSKRREEKGDRNSEHWAAWEAQVRARDGNMCQFPNCKANHSVIDPHHIAPRSQRKDLIYVVTNGICLGREHHDWVHGNPIEAERLGLLSTRSRELAMKEGTIGIR